MTPLASTDLLPLTCTREGACCHGHHIWINPWELAVLARTAALDAEVFRARYTECQGTRLRFDGPPDARGKSSCRLYDPSRGCTVHGGRPLTCRTYPLGRARSEGAVVFYHPGTRLPCLDTCPSVTTLPSLTVQDYLVGQDIHQGEIAHDGYANLVYGMIAVARNLCDQGASEGVDRAAVLAGFDDAAAASMEDRTAILPQVWVDLLTLLPADLPLERPDEVVRRHGERINAAVQMALNQSGASLTEAAHLYTAMAFHLAATIGGDVPAMRGLLTD